MEKRDLINAFADTMDKHTNSIADVKTIMWTLNDISEFLMDSSCVEVGIVSNLGNAFKEVDDNKDLGRYTKNLHKPVFSYIEMVMHAKNYTDALEKLSRITTICTENEDFEQSYDEDPILKSN